MWGRALFLSRSLPPISHMQTHSRLWRNISFFPPECRLTPKSASILWMCNWWEHQPVNITGGKLLQKKRCIELTGCRVISPRCAPQLIGVINASLSLSALLRHFIKVLMLPCKVKSAFLSSACTLLIKASVRKDRGLHESGSVHSEGSTSPRCLKILSYMLKVSRAGDGAFREESFLCLWSWMEL